MVDQDAYRGTRPGSPLADIIFHSLMAVVAQKVDAWLLQKTEYQALLREINIEMPTILWADDIAVCLATKSAVDLVPLLQTTLHVVRQTHTEF